MKAVDVGEAGLLEEIGRILGVSPDKSVVVGFGDDAASVVPSEGMEIVMTCDVQVEGVHFDPRQHGFGRWGKRAMTAALSDVAAMGAIPRWCLASLGLQDDLLLEEFRSLYKGFAAVAEHAGVTLVGGNVSRVGERCFCDIFVAGEVERGGAVARGAAAPGELVAVSGYPGRAAAGLAVLERREPKTDTEKHIVGAYLEPTARLTLGRELARRHLVGAMTDISDGLVRDLGHICEASGCGGVVRPACLEDDQLAEVAASLARRQEEFVFGASDDYELLFTVRPEDWQAVAELAGSLGQGPARVIGEIRQEPGLFFEHVDSTLTPVGAGGWNALRGIRQAVDSGQFAKERCPRASGC